MFDIKPDSRMTTEEQLLFNIWQELKQLNNKNNGIEKPVEKAITDKKVVKESKEVKCKACGGTHANMGEMLACCRKHKKGVK